MRKDTRGVRQAKIYQTNITNCTHTYQPSLHSFNMLLVLSCTTSDFPPCLTHMNTFTRTHIPTPTSTPTPTHTHTASLPPSRLPLVSPVSMVQSPLSLLPRVLVGGGLHGSPASTLQQRSLRQLNSSNRPVHERQCPAAYGHTRSHAKHSTRAGAPSTARG